MLDSGDEWSNSSRCRQESVYMSRMWCLYTWSCLDILIIIHVSINCSAVICSPTVILMLSWEKPLVKPMPLGLFSIIQVSNLLYFAIFAFNLYHKNTKNIYLIIIISIRSHSCKRPWRDWQPLYRVGCEFVCVGMRWLTRGLLLDWYLGSQKLREILTLLYCITLSSSRENQRSAQEVA